MIAHDGAARRPLPQRRLLVVLAHPDDESFGAGGTIARASQGGWDTLLLCATRGEAGAIAPQLQGRVSREALGDVRAAELHEAARILGIHAVQFLPYRDGTLETVPSAEGRAAVASVMRSFRPDVVLTFCPEDGITGHPDHRAVGAWTTDAFRSLFEEGRLARGPRLYWLAIPAEDFSIPDAMLMDPSVPRGTPLSEISTAVEVRSVIGRKCDAILAHRTQVGTADADVASPIEYFRRVVPPWRRGDAVEDWIW